MNVISIFALESVAISIFMNGNKSKSKYAQLDLHVLDSSNICFISTLHGEFWFMTIIHHEGYNKNPPLPSL